MIDRGIVFPSMVRVALVLLVVVCTLACGGTVPGPNSPGSRGDTAGGPNAPCDRDDDCAAGMSCCKATDRGTGNRCMGATPIGKCPP